MIHEGPSNRPLMRSNVLLCYGKHHRTPTRTIINVKEIKPMGLLHMTCDNTKNALYKLQVFAHSVSAVVVSLMMYSFMGGGLFCAIVGNILLVVSTATDYWMQYRLSGSFAHQGLWRYCMSGKCYMQTDSIAYWNATRAFMILSAMSCFAGIIAGILSFAHFSTFERFNRSFAAGIMFFVSTLFVLLAMAIYTGVTVNFLGKRFGDWRFSWSYILGWVALLMTFFAGIFYMCAYRMHECRRVAGPR
ncbi:Lens fiber membrane intrinsic protein MP17 MP18 MP19 MP20 [Channa argus]|uniref:Lens fiber membrane intrinsic protein n=2 Tax=Channa argus TaxID=215402 RepID=A0A6G1PQ00_CHAAH|nr:Lens fiber membrane intrinsic protein MP17 MP18 MP19 MP20 [Channa argus]